MKLKFLMRTIPVIDSSVPLDGYKLVLYLGEDPYIISAIGKDELAYVRTSSHNYQNMVERNDIGLEDWVIYEVKKL
jgi:hypothetical protein